MASLVFPIFAEKWLFIIGPRPPPFFQFAARAVPLRRLSRSPTEIFLDYFKPTTGLQ